MPIDRYNCHENSRVELSQSPASLFICRGLSQCYLPEEFFGEKKPKNFQLDIYAIESEHKNFRSDKIVYYNDGLHPYSYPCKNPRISPPLLIERYYV